MSNTYKDVGNLQDWKHWGSKRPGLNYTCLRHNIAKKDSKKLRKITAKLERQEGKQQCLEGIEESYVGWWVDRWPMMDFIGMMHRTEEFNIQSLTVNDEYGIIHEWNGRHAGFNVIRAFRWDGTIEINLYSLVKEL